MPAGDSNQTFGACRCSLVHTGHTPQRMYDSNFAEILQRIQPLASLYPLIIFPQALIAKYKNISP